MKKVGLTANDEGFCPDDDTLWDAYWLLLDLGGFIYLYDVHLIEDEGSPSGYGFNCYASVLGEDASWHDIGGGLWWDYSSADQLLSEFPSYYNRRVVLTRREFERVRNGFFLLENEEWD